MIWNLITIQLTTKYAMPCKDFTLSGQHYFCHGTYSGENTPPPPTTDTMLETDAPIQPNICVSFRLDLLMNLFASKFP